MNPPTPEPLQYIVEAVPATVGGRKPMTDHHRAWISRRRKEREDIPLNAAERQQYREQLEDL